MATDTSSPAASEAFGTSETINYIRKLHQNWTNAQLQLTKYETALKNLQNQKKNIGEEFTRVRTDMSSAKAHLKEAQAAYDKVSIIVQFFKSRTEVAKNMVDQAYNMALAIFEASEFLNQEGLERVEEIKKLVAGYNQAQQGDSSNQWSDILTAAILDADSQGVSAFTTATKAVMAAFKAYISNQEIFTRTKNYYNKFTKYEKEIRDVITRKNKELSLINRRYVFLLSKNDALELQVNDINGKVQDLTFEVNQYHDEFNAAQLSAEYKYTPPSPAS
jgi:peptidoglycan hydrolase CwlO-like protein